MRRPRSRGRAVRGVVAALLTVLTNCGKSDVEVSRGRPNVVIVVGDALRADRLGAYRNSRRLTPNLDSLAEHAFVFRNAYTAAPWTLPSLGSLFTSRFPSRLGLVSFGSVLPDEEKTLAEVLGENGYTTAAFLAHWFLVARGLEQGFEAYLQPLAKGAKTRGPELNELVFGWLDRRNPAEQSPMLLYVHYAEPHIPYSPPRAALESTLAGGEIPDLEALNRLARSSNKGAQNLSVDQLRQIMAVYDAEVASLDQAVAELVRGLEARGLFEHAVLVITADHGEAFLEHGTLGHGASLFEEVIRVPLLIRAPGQPAHAHVDDPVSLVDVAPTVLRLAGVEVPDSFDGHSLEPAMRWASSGWLARLSLAWERITAESRPVFSERSATFAKLVQPNHRQAVILGSEKHIAAPHHAGEFYDLSTDPREQRPGALNAAARERLRQALRSLGDPVKKVEPPGPSFDAQTRERLRALGYADE